MTPREGRPGEGLTPEERAMAWALRCGHGRWLGPAQFGACWNCIAEMIRKSDELDALRLDELNARPSGSWDQAITRLKASLPINLSNAIWLAAKDGNGESPRHADAVLVAAIKAWPATVDEIIRALRPAARPEEG